MLRARWVLPLAVGAGLGAALARREPRERGDEAEGLLARLPVLPAVAAASLPAPPGSGRTELSKYGLPGLAQLRSRESYVLCYDPRSRSALWVIEQLNRDTLSGASDRAACDFQEDDSVHEYHRATNADYRGSGFDRGHLAAAANHRWSQKAMKDTFYLSNIAPQVRPEARGGSRSCPRSRADAAPCGKPPGRVAVFVPTAVQAERGQSHSEVPYFLLNLTTGILEMHQTVCASQAMKERSRSVQLLSGAELNRQTLAKNCGLRQ